MLLFIFLFPITPGISCVDRISVGNFVPLALVAIYEVQLVIQKMSGDCKSFQDHLHFNSIKINVGWFTVCENVEQNFCFIFIFLAAREHMCFTITSYFWWHVRFASLFEGDHGICSLSIFIFVNVCIQKLEISHDALAINDHNTYIQISCAIGVTLLFYFKHLYWLGYLSKILSTQIFQSKLRMHAIWLWLNMFMDSKHKFRIFLDMAT